MTRTLAVLSTILGASFLAGAYFIGSYIWLAALMVSFDIFLIIAFLRHWGWFHSPWLFLVFAFAGLAIFLDLSTEVIFPGVVLSLAGWDLAAFDARLQLAGYEDDTHLLQRRHFIRLGLVLVTGLVLTLMAINLQLYISFGWMAILSLIAAGGLGVLIHSLLINEQD